MTERPRERWFETATIFWLGAVVPPFGACLSLSALIDRWRRRLLPRWTRWPAVPLAVLPCLWLVAWGWSRATRLHFDPDSGLYQPWLDVAALDPIERIFLVSTVVHYLAGALVGALWGARTAPGGSVFVRAGLGAIAGAGWAWFAAGLYLLAGPGAALGPAGAGFALVFLLVPIACLATARWVERTGGDESLDWTRIAD